MSGCLFGWQAECYDYLFESAIKLRQLGIDAAIAPTATRQNGVMSPASGGLLIFSASTLPLPRNGPGLEVMHSMASQGGIQ